MISLAFVLVLRDFPARPLRQTENRLSIELDARLARKMQSLISAMQIEVHLPNNEPRTIQAPSK
jgi:hypothetical protein